MATLDLNKCVFAFFLLVVSCSHQRDRGKDLEKVQEECLKKKSIGGLNFNFMGYPYQEIKSIQVNISGSEVKSQSLTVPEKILDSLRLKRSVYFSHLINLKDTVTLTFSNQEKHMLTDFKYLVRSHPSMLSHKWSCDFYEMKIDGITKAGGSASFVHPEFKL